MKVSFRTIKILEYILSKKREVTIKEISEELQIEQRSVRYEFENINLILYTNDKTKLVDSSRGMLFVRDFDFLEKSLNILKEIKNASKEEREDYIFLKLLFEGRLNLKKLTLELNVSRTTIKKDIEFLKKRFKKENLKVMNNSLSSEELKENNELKKRKILINILDKYIEDFIHDFEHNLRTKYLKTLFTKKELELIEKFLRNISDYNLKENKLYKTLYIYMVIVIQRIRTNNRLLKNQNSGFLRTTDEYLKVNQEIKILERTFEILFDENEKLQITDFLIGFFSYSYNTSIFDVWIKVNILIKEMIKNVEKTLNISLSNDALLLEGLVNHIKPAIYRIKNNITIEKMQVYYDEARDIYPQLFKLIRKELKQLEQTIEIEFPDNELLLFIIHFQAAIERNLNTENKIRKIALVCIGGYGTTNILAYKLKKIYEIDEIKIISYLDINKSYENIDAILTIVDLNIKIKENISIPIIKVTPFLTENDIQNLHENGFSKKQNKYDYDEIVQTLDNSIKIVNKDEFTKKLQKLFNINIHTDIDKKLDLFNFLKEKNVLYEQEKIKNWEEAVKIGFSPLIKDKYIKKSYYENVIELIKNFGSYMVISDGIAIPHAENENNVLESGISLLYLKYPVVFPKNKRVNLLFCLSAVNRKDHSQSLKDILVMEERFSFKERLRDINSRENILSILKEYKESKKHI